MKFVYPEFLWSLLALSIPVIIHLFNFRRYKTLYFSSLQFLKKVDEQTRATKKVKHLIILCLRILALACLIFAFAQPFIPVESAGSKGGKPVLSIYIDNSFSMTSKGTEGELLSEAREMARKMIKKAPIDTRILLSTNKMDGFEQRFITKADALEMLDKIEPIALVRNLDDVLNWQRGFIEKEGSEKVKINSVQYVFFSDFQRSTASFKKLEADKFGNYYPVLLTPQSSENIYIDSIWFSSPVQKVGLNNELNVRVVNDGNSELTNAELHLDIKGIKRDVFLDIPANESVVTVLNYTEPSAGFKTGKLSVNDKQLFWDDDFYFSYFVDNQTKVLLVNGEDASPSISQVLFLEKYYKIQSLDENSFTLDALNQKDLIILNGLNDIPSGMADNLRSFAQSGGTIAFFPGTKVNTGTYNSILSDLSLPMISNLSTSGTKIDKLVYDDPFFQGMFEKKKESLNLPAVNKFYQSYPQSKSLYFELITLQNGMPLFVRSEGSINAFLFTSSLDPSFGTFTSDALFPSLVLRIGEMSQRRAPLFLTIGKESFFPLYKKQIGESPIHLKNKKVDFIPRVQKLGLISYISLNGQEALELLKDGIYEVVDDKVEAYVALNYDRRESNIHSLDETEIETELESAGIKNVTFSHIAEGQSLTKIDLEKPFEYWKMFVLLALLFFLSEMLVLKFWK